MTLQTLLISIAIVAIVLTVVIHFGIKKIKNWPLSLLQNFCGALFIFSGYVKAVDPLGTAYKMEQYFAEFESTFADTTFSFLAPLFPWLAGFAVAFSVFMIVLEIVLGLMLILGAWRKSSAWLFFLIVFFFTFLTGFTYLTGYVPQGVNFFAFGDWGSYVETNMKVTDCGCFGDFLKLEPKVSFLKDVFLLVPAFIFLFAAKRMHQLFTPSVRTIAIITTAGVVLLYCMSNYVWDIPGRDFRPFKVGVDIAAEKIAEEDAAASREVLGYLITNRETKEVTKFTMNEFLANYQDYPEEDFEIEQQLSELTKEATKISEFEVSDREGYDQAPGLLEREGYSFVIVAYRLKGEKDGTRTETIQELITRIDTILVDNSDLIARIDTLEELVAKEIEVPNFSWDAAYLKKWETSIQPLMDAAMEKGHHVVALTKYEDIKFIDSFRETIGAGYDFLQGDDIMLKTIIRSNPGVLLMREGVILDKWHYRKLPDYATIVQQYGLDQ